MAHYNDVIVIAMASQITSLTIVYPSVYSGTDQRKHQRSASLDFVRGIHRWPVNSPHKGPVARKMFPFDDVIMGAPKITHACIIHWLMNFCNIWEAHAMICLQPLKIDNQYLLHLSDLHDLDFEGVSTSIHVRSTNQSNYIIAMPSNTM